MNHSIGTRRRGGFDSNLSYTSALIAANVAVFIGVLILMGFFGDDLIVSWIALMPAMILEGRGVWTFLTSMFMHAGIGHLFVNMVSLMFIGSFVEKLIGKKRFISLYFIGGLFAGLFFVLIALATGSDLNVYAVGASGAIFALGGLLAVLTPRLPVLVFFVIPMPMWAAMGFLMFGLWALSLGLGLPIGNTAHLGGLIVGLGYGFYLKRRFPRKTAMISKYFAR
ncbi:rhomboid family intramembrane serine protease [archaeon]|jgi:membrane associated rhomboid family serine protease|nr:rhomboid family intramembrane serine protease [archaeon]MBT7128719.1 rhomboid family intramembrane serine protease [archaeon]